MKTKVLDDPGVKLTGTAAIKVGLSIVQSPLLPFLILVDYKAKNRKIYKVIED